MLPLFKSHYSVGRSILTLEDRDEIESNFPDSIITISLKHDIKRPILHLATHNLLAYIQPIIDSIGEKLKIVEIVRHPLYMIIQQMKLDHQKFP